MGLLAFATRADSFYMSKEKEPENPNVQRTLLNGLQDLSLVGTIEKPAAVFGCFDCIKLIFNCYTL